MKQNTIMMSILRMTVREIAVRRSNFLLGLAGVSAAVGLLIGILTALTLHANRSEQLAAEKEEESRATMAAMQADVKKAMHRLGYNAILLPKDQPLSDWYAEDYATRTMPASWAARLDDTQRLVDRYVPQLRQKLMWKERQWTIQVVGAGRERILDTSVCEPAALVEPIAPGTCVVGYELHNALGLKEGEEIAVCGKRFRIAKCQRELGTKDDITIRMNLADAQQLLQQADRINEILVVEHLNVWGNLPEVRRRVAAVLPDCQVVEIASETMSRAHARVKVAEEAQAAIKRERERRDLLRAERRKAMLTLVPLGSLVCAVWIGLLTYVNVRDRAPEIGVLMAIGFRSGQVRTLMLSKAAVLGMVGGLLGFLLGTGGAVLIEIWRGGSAPIGPADILEHFGLAQAIGVATCLVGSWLPARTAATMDPADVLREQ